jgi:hypothetical protein
MKAVFLTSATLAGLTAAAPEAHLSGGLAHNAARHDEECANGVHVDCQVETNWAWSQCSPTCGEGTATRTRAVTVEPCNNGAACPVLTETRVCMTKVCEVLRMIVF